MTVVNIPPQVRQPCETAMTAQTRVSEYLDARRSAWAHGAADVTVRAIAATVADAELRAALRALAEQGRALVRATRHAGYDVSPETIHTLVDLEAVLMVAESVAAAPALDGPVTTWRAAAGVLSVSEDLLLERRRAARDHSKPWWPNAAAVTTWFQSLSTTPPRRRREKGETVLGAAVDWNRVRV